MFSVSCVFEKELCSGKVSVDPHFRNDAHMQSRAKIHLVELFDWENCQKVFLEVSFHRRLQLQKKLDARKQQICHVLIFFQFRLQAVSRCLRFEIVGLVASRWRRCIPAVPFLGIQQEPSTSDASSSVTFRFLVGTGECKRSPDAWILLACDIGLRLFLSWDQRWALFMSHCSLRDNSFAFWLWLWRRACVFRGFINTRMAFLRHVMSRQNQSGDDWKWAAATRLTKQYQTEWPIQIFHVWRCERTFRRNFCDLLISGHLSLKCSNPSSLD